MASNLAKCMDFFAFSVTRFGLNFSALFHTCLVMANNFIIQLQTLYVTRVTLKEKFNNSLWESVKDFYSTHLFEREKHALERQQTSYFKESDLLRVPVKTELLSTSNRHYTTTWKKPVYKKKPVFGFLTVKIE